MISDFSKYKFLSNFTLVPVKLDNLTFPSVEHAYMSAKSDSIVWKQYCTLSTNHPAVIKKKSRTINLIHNWEDIKVDIMEQCLKQKFNQEPFKTLLLETGDEYIQEGNWWNDKFWGVCLKTGEGSNYLGVLLMKIREELK